MVVATESFKRALAGIATFKSAAAAAFAFATIAAVAGEGGGGAQHIAVVASGLAKRYSAHFAHFDRRRSMLVMADRARKIWRRLLDGGSESSLHFQCPCTNISSWSNQL
mmetsp:Transcript_32058/g.42501  ORF Transcript_32058/g.42501 Transcript_32058/m.42501 type:complete len:109 (-) Transcript_32058:442-768(-)